jgi:hypothetical protein
MRTCRPPLALLLSVILASPAAWAAGDDSRAIEAGRKAFEAGVVQFDKRDYEGARILFAQSYGAFPAIDALRNLAIAELESDRPLEALRHFKQYALDSHADAEFVRTKLPAYLERCNQRVGHLRFAVPADTLVRVDRRPVVDATAVVDVARGDHAVELSHGAVQRALTVHVAEGQTLDVPLELPAPAPPPQATPAPPHVEAPRYVQPVGTPVGSWWTTGHTVAVVSAGVALAGLAVGVGAYISATNNSNNGDAIRSGLSDRAGCSQCADLNDEISAVRRDNIISATGFTIAGVAGALATVFLLVGDRRSTVGTIEWMPAVGPGGATILGRF